jgi:hypothetical protein
MIVSAWNGAEKLCPKFSTFCYLSIKVQSYSKSVRRGEERTEESLLTHAKWRQTRMETRTP